MIVQIDNYRFHTQKLYDNDVFMLDIPDLDKAQKIKLLTRMLTKSYSPDYMTYLINTALPTFLVKPEFLREQDT